MMKISIVTMICLLLVLAGCNQADQKNSPLEVELQKLKEENNQLRKELETKEFTIMELERQMETTLRFSNSDSPLMELVADAFRRQWRVMFADANENQEDHFTENDILYTYYSKDIDTKPEMESYLNSVFTLLHNGFHNEKHSRKKRQII